jgi:hypothetical protein
MKNPLALAAIMSTVLTSTYSVAATQNMRSEITNIMNSKSTQVLNDIGKPNNRFISYNVGGLSFKSENWQWNDATISFEPLISVSDRVAVCAPQKTELSSDLKLEFENSATVSKNVVTGSSDTLSESLAISIGAKAFGESIKATGTFAAAQTFSSSISKAKTTKQTQESSSSITFQQQLDFECSAGSNKFGPIIANVYSNNTVEKIHSATDVHMPATYTYDVSLDRDIIQITSKSPDTPGNNLNVMLYDKNRKAISDRNVPGATAAQFDWVFANGLPRNAKFINVAFGWSPGEHSVNVCNKKGVCSAISDTNKFTTLPYGQKDLWKIQVINRTYTPGVTQTDNVSVRRYVGSDYKKTMSGTYTLSGLKEIESTGSSNYEFYLNANDDDQEMIVTQCGDDYETLAARWDKMCNYDPQLRANYFEVAVLSGESSCSDGQTWNGTQEKCMEPEDQSPNTYYLWNNELARKSVLVNGVARCKITKNWSAKKLACK